MTAAPIEAVCDDPPAMVPLGSEVSPYSNVTCVERQSEPLGGVLRLDGRGAHAHLVARHLHDGAPVGGEPDAGGAAGHAVIGIGGGRARPCRSATRPRGASRGAGLRCSQPNRSAPRR